MAQTPEGLIKAKIVKYLKTLAPDCWYAPYVQNGYGKSGVPDYIVCFKGKFIALEVKAPGKKATPWQEREIESILKAGGVALVVTCVKDVDGAIKWAKA